MFSNMYFNSINYFLFVSSVCISSQASITPIIYSGNQSYSNLTLADQPFHYLGGEVINLTPEEEEALELEALREAIAAPRIGLNGEDRTPSAPREGSGKGRQDDIRPIHRSNQTKRYQQGFYGKSGSQTVEINERVFLVITVILFLS